MLEILGISATAEAVYRAMLRQPDWPVDELATQLGLTQTQVRDGLDELASKALFSPSAQAISPSVGLAPLLDLVEAEIRRRQQQAAEARTAISTFVAEVEATRDRDHVLHLSGLGAVRGRLRELAASTRTECLSFTPGGASSPDSIESSKALDQQAVARGVSVRAVYQDTFRNDRATLEYARWLNEIGGQTRTVPLLPLRMVVVDREIALLPLDPDASRLGALEVRSRGIVALAVAHFEAVWVGALPFGEDSQVPDEDGLTGLHRQLLKLLAEGVTDEVAARRLGLSDRSVRRMMSQLANQLGALSRFQIAVLATRRNWI